MGSVRVSESSGSEFDAFELDDLSQRLGSYSLSADVSEVESVSGFSLFSVDFDSPAPLPAAAPVQKQGKPGTDVCEVQLMAERFAKLLLGEDMSGGRKGVCTALAISNAITNLSATVFGSLWKLEPLAAQKKLMWHREMEWLLCVSDNIIELIPSVQESPDGGKYEVMVTRPRSDLSVNLPALKKLDAMLLSMLDDFCECEFFYVDRGGDDDNEAGHMPSSSGRPSIRLEEKWWLPFPKVPLAGLSEGARKRLQQCRDCVNQIHKASSAINSAVLAEMEIPNAYLDGLPKSAKTCLGEILYRHMTNDRFSPQRFLDYYLNQSSEHATVEFANRIEASMHIWRLKYCRRLIHTKAARSTWGGKVKGFVHDIHKCKVLSQRAETLLQNLRLRFPDLPQTDLDMSKIQHNKDVGKSILESYSRVMESLSFNIMALIDDIKYVDDATKQRKLPLLPSLNDWRTPGITIPIPKQKSITRSRFSVQHGTCASPSSNPCRSC